MRSVWPGRAGQPECDHITPLRVGPHTQVGGSVLQIVQIVALRPIEALLCDHADCFSNVGV